MDDARSLILPNRVSIQLIDENHDPVGLANVLFSITAFARRRNDFHFGPFPTDGEGIARITKQQLDAGVADEYESDLMGHVGVEECLPSVEIRVLSPEDIGRALEARKYWRHLLSGERKRWSSLDELLALYRNATNIRLLMVPDSSAIRADWSAPEAEFSYEFIVTPLPPNASP